MWTKLRLFCEVGNTKAKIAKKIDINKLFKVFERNHENLPSNTIKAGRFRSIRLQCDEELFDKFWDVIMPPVFIEMLINGLDNGHIEQHDDDEFDDYYEADFDEVYDMYGDDIELEHSSCCICRIPEEWLS